MVSGHFRYYLLTVLKRRSYVGAPTTAGGFSPSSLRRARPDELQCLFIAEPAQPSGATNRPKAGTSSGSHTNIVRMYQIFREVAWVGVSDPGAFHLQRHGAIHRRPFCSGSRMYVCTLKTPSLFVFSPFTGNAPI